MGIGWRGQHMVQNLSGGRPKPSAARRDFQPAGLSHTLSEKLHLLFHPEIGIASCFISPP
jgi:hypothetical protein